jgi:adenylate cyclase
MLAEASALAGQIEAALAILDEALAGVTLIGERHSEAELYRLKGKLLLQATSQARTSGTHQPPSRAAETCFQQALERAHRQHAKGYELRAAMSLSRLWQARAGSLALGRGGRGLWLVHRGL